MYPPLTQEDIFGVEAGPLHKRRQARRSLRDSVAIGLIVLGLVLTIVWVSALLYWLVALVF